jgi:ribulose-5-phosphate 4-epimerase/fuculose-1-phosphate aldolase
MEDLSSMMEEFAAACRKAASYGLMRCSSGNMSRRVDRERILVKASRAWMAECTAEDVALCRLADGQSLNDKKPSVEIGFHTGILRQRDDVDVVLHFQTPSATTLACRRDLESIDFFAIPEVPYYIGKIGLIPYILPGSVRLATVVTQTMKDHNLAVLANHGMVTVGKDYDDAIQKAVFFELACEIILKAGVNLRALTDEAVKELKSGSA